MSDWEDDENSVQTRTPAVANSNEKENVCFGVRHANRFGGSRTGPSCDSWRGRDREVFSGGGGREEGRDRVFFSGGGGREGGRDQVVFSGGGGREEGRDQVVFSGGGGREGGRDRVFFSGGGSRDAGGRDGPDSTPPVTLNVENSSVGRVIGRGGAKIRELEESTGARIKTENSFSVSVPIFKQFHKYIIGKGGANIKKIREETYTKIDLPAKNSNSEMIVITGKKANCELARVRILAIQKEKELANITEVSIPSKVHYSLLGPKGHFVRSMEECGGVDIQFPTKGSGIDTVTIRGPAEEVEKAKRQLLSLAEEKQIKSLRAKPEYHKFLIGKGGGNIRKVREATGARIIFPTVDDKDQELIIVVGTEEAVREAQKELEELIKSLDNVVEDVMNVDPKHHRYFLARRGQVLRDIAEEYGGVMVSFPRTGAQSDKVTLKGATDCVEAAKKRMLEIIDDLQIKSLRAKPEYHKFLIGKGGGNIRKVHEATGATIIFPTAEDKDQELIIVVGTEEAVREAQKELEELIKSLDNVVEDVMNVDPKHRRYFLARRGQVLRDIAEEYGGVMVSFPRTGAQSDKVTLKGATDCVEAAKKRMLEIIDDLQIKSLRAKPEYHKFLIGKGGGNIRKVHEATGATIIFPTADDKDQELIIVVGTEEAVREAQKELEELNKSLAMRGESQQKEKEVAELLDTAVAKQVSRLAEQVDVLRELREGNPWNARSDSLTRSISVVINNSTSAPVAMEKVDVAWENYRIAQEKLKACQTKEQLVDLINDRNLSRNALTATVDAFLQEAKCLAVGQRVDKLEEVRASLTAVFGPVFGPASVEGVVDDAFEQFYQWKALRDQHTSAVRDGIDKALHALCTWSENLGKEQNNQDSEIMTDAFHQVTQLIKKEKELIAEITDKHLLSTKFKGETLHWQDATPTPETLLSIQKRVRRLRYQMRCTQLEQCRLEEGEELNLTEVLKKKEEMAETRKALFQELGKEKEEYRRLAALTDGSFPELPLLYPEADIHCFMSSGGLLVKSLDRDMFDAEPMRELSGRRPLVCTEYQGQRVVLKGYSVDEEAEAGVLERTTLFHRARTENGTDGGVVLPLLALFFGKSDPLAYVMVPYFPHGSLKAVQAVQPLTATEVTMVMRGVAQGLQALQAVGVTHASLNPNNVFVLKREQGMLGDFDFTKATGQRAMGRGMVAGSISLVAPELRDGSAPSPACDLYSFGCLLLWLHVPTFSGALDDPANLTLDVEAKLQALLPKLLARQGRLTAAQVLADDYFLSGQA